MISVDTVNDNGRLVDLASAQEYPSDERLLSRTIQTYCCGGDRIGLIPTCLLSARNYVKRTLF